MSETNDGWPAFMDRRTAAAYISSRYYTVTHRVLEKWPLTVYRPGKRALHAREELDMVAQGTIEASLVRSAA